MLKKIFLATLVLTLFVASALAVVTMNEQNNVNKEAPIKNKQNFKVLTIDEDSPDNPFKEDVSEYLNHLIRELREEVDDIPAIVIPSY